MKPCYFTSTPPLIFILFLGPFWRSSQLSFRSVFIGVQTSLSNTSSRRTQITFQRSKMFWGGRDLPPTHIILQNIFLHQQTAADVEKTNLRSATSLLHITGQNPLRKSESCTQIDRQGHSAILFQFVSTTTVTIRCIQLTFQSSKTKKELGDSPLLAPHNFCGLSTK